MRKKNLLCCFVGDFRQLLKHHWLLSFEDCSSFWQSSLGHGCFASLNYFSGHRLLSLKVPNVEINFDESFLPLLQPCKQYMEILHRISHLHAIISTRLIFGHYCIQCKCMSTYIKLELEVWYFQ